MSDSDTQVALGVSTRREVDILRKEFGEVLEVGQLFTYERIAELIQSPVRSNRWRSVTNAWRKELYRESNIMLLSFEAKAFKVGSGEDRTHFCVSGQKTGLRKVRRVARVAERTDQSTLSPENQRILTHVRNVAAMVKLAVDTQSKGKCQVPPPVVRNKPVPLPQLVGAAP